MNLSIDANHLQNDYDIRFEWAEYGAVHIARPDHVAIIVDVLSFSTALDVACSRGALVFPYRFRDAGEAAFAQRQGAVLAVHRGGAGFSLSPPSLANLPSGTRLVLPSPNGSTLTILCSASTVAAGCLRNASSVATWADAHKKVITVIAAGERWPDGTLRPAIEDLIGAGAIISRLSGRKSPEARIAELAWTAVKDDVRTTIAECASGQELIQRGYAEDVDYAVDVDVSTSVPVFSDGCYRQAQ